MIQVYTFGNTDFDVNGDMVLFPESASVHAVLGGTWEASLTHPRDREGRWMYLTKEAVVKMPSFNGDQLFRVREARKTDSGVECTMDPVFYDCRDEIFITAKEIDNKNGPAALNALCSGKYSATTDITKTNSASLEDVNLLEALVGENDNSFINRWGGEPVYDNYTLIINETAGADRGVEIRYGKNIPENGMEVDVDMSNVITRVYPKDRNGNRHSSYVDSPIAANYAKVYAGSKTYDDVVMWADATAEDESDNNIIVCNDQAELDAALAAKVNADFASGLDKPEVTITTEIVLLQNTKQYADIAQLESVSLGDVVHCINTHLDVTTDARVVELYYNPVKKRIESVTLGAYKETYFTNFEKTLRTVDSIDDRLKSVMNGNGTVKAETIAGFINGAKAILSAQYDAATGSDYVAVLFENLDATSATYGAMAIGTQGIMISRQRNQANTDWIWTTAMTAEGLIANIIMAGLISDASGTNTWDLDNGIITTRNLRVLGGSIDITTSGSDFNTIRLRGSDGYYIEMGNSGWRIVNDSGETVAFGQLDTGGNAGITVRPSGGTSGDDAELGPGYLTAGENRYKSNNEYGLNMRDSDIVNINGMYAADEATGPAEGMNWPNGLADGWWDSLWARGGILYFCPENQGAGTYKKKVWHEGNLSPGYGNSDSATVPVTSESAVAIDNFQVPAGFWVIDVVVRYNSNPTGYRQAWLSDTATGGAVAVAAIDYVQAVTGAQTFCRITYCVRLASAQTFYLVGKQNSGSSLNAISRARWIGIET